MRNLFLAFLVLAQGSFAWSKTIEIVSDESRETELLEVPQEILGLMLDQGVPLKDEGNGVHSMVLSQVRCDSHSNDNVEGVRAGIYTQKCRYQTEETQGSETGTKINEGRALFFLLLAVDQIRDAGIVDCSLGGHCGAWLESIRCQVDTKIETFKAGRFSCVLEDGQE